MQTDNEKTMSIEVEDTDFILDIDNVINKNNDEKKPSYSSRLIKPKLQGRISPREEHTFTVKMENQIIATITVEFGHIRAAIIKNDREILDSKDINPNSGSTILRHTLSSEAIKAIKEGRDKFILKVKNLDNKTSSYKISGTWRSPAKN